ncbi:MAG: tyrosine-type recombinase/integrase [Pseudomonas sp.]|uniref:tyrosine-type recombinase/integrase n=1 Tax=Pseudomonas sp. TaxID=306 RepID=UPI003D14669A
MFPAGSLSVDPCSGNARRHYFDDKTCQALLQAVRAAGIEKLATPHTLLHSFAMYLVESSQGIRPGQELLGHADMKTSMIFAHALNRDGLSMLGLFGSRLVQPQSYSSGRVA